MKEYNETKKELNDKIQFYKEARMPQEMIDNDETVLSLKNKAVELKNKINKQRGVKMAQNLQNNNKNNFMEVEFESEFMNNISEFITDNDSYNHLSVDNAIDNLEDNPDYLAKIVINLTDDYYKPSTDVGDEGPMSMAKDIISSNIKEDMISEVLCIVRDYYS